MLNLLNFIKIKIVDYYYLLLLIFLSIMTYLGYVNLISGFIFSYVICAMLTLFVHEYAQHNIITFKHSLTQYLFLVIAYIYSPFVSSKNQKGYMISHIIHHKFWFINEDPVTAAVNENTFMFFCNTFARVDKKTTLSMILDIDVSRYQPTWYYPDWLVNYRFTILTICSVVYILLFGVANYISFYVLPLTYIVIVYCAVPDIFFHTNKRPYKDIPWMLPIWFNTAYHISHHKNANKLYFGSKWWKYINLQYWIFLIAFTKNETNNNRIY